MSNRKKTPKEKALRDATTVLPKRNEKGEIIQWSSTSQDGKLLRTLVENGNITNKMTAKQIREKYTMFNAYAYACFNSALANTRRSVATEMEAREPQTGRGGAGGHMRAYSNLKEGDFEDDDDDDDDDDDESYQISRLSLNDHHDDNYSSYGGGAKSVTFNASSGRSIRSGIVGMAHGTPPRPPSSGKKESSSPVSTPHKLRPVHCALPFIIDYWHDGRPQERASIQVQILSMNEEMMSRMSYRVSTAQNELVMMMPVSEHFGLGPLAFNNYVLADLDVHESKKHAQILNYHPKVTARRLLLAKLKEKSPAANTIMEFRIPLRRKFSLDFASVAHNDPYFYGSKFVGYPDGSVFLHIELVADTVEGSNTPLDRNSAQMMFYGAQQNVPDSVSIPSGGGTSACDDDFSYMEETVMTAKTTKTTKSSKTSASKSSSAKPQPHATPTGTPTGVVATLGTPTGVVATLGTGVARATTPFSTSTTSILNIATPTYHDAYSTSGFSGGASTSGRSVKSRRTVGPVTSGNKRKLKDGGGSGSKSVVTNT
jgi:hypothetical protein